LWALSQELFGNPLRWKEILELNPQIKNPNLIVEGSELRVPLMVPKSANAGAALPDDEEKVQYRKLKPVDIAKLLERGQSELKAKRFDQSLSTFGEALAQGDALTPAQRADAELGRGLSSFHQKGCAAALKYLGEAAKDVRHEDEARYYQALCLVEDKKLAEADRLFEELVRKRSPRFAEESLFYRGFLADQEDRWGDAESAYQDTIDFAEQKRLVTLADERLRAMRARKLTAWSEQKVFFVTGSLGLGYDSNVVALPRSLAPSQYGLKSSSSLSALGVASISVKNPWVNPWDHRVRYNYLILHYLDSTIASGNDLQSHDVSTSLDKNLSQRDQGGVSLGYSSVWLGKAGVASEYLRLPSGELRWSRVMGDLEKPSALLNSSLRYTYNKSLSVPLTTDQDQNAQSILVSSRYLIRSSAPHMYGPGADLEFHPAKGKDNSYFAATAVGRWDLPVGPEKWQLFASQEASIGYAKYYQHTLKRGDLSLKYSGTLTKIWAPWLETRLQVAGTMAFSNLSSYDFNRAQVNLGASVSY
jgi:tetratricopeptide (TPR) repeat protein